MVGKGYVSFSLKRGESSLEVILIKVPNYKSHIIVRCYRIYEKTKHRDLRLIAAISVLRTSSLHEFENPQHVGVALQHVMCF